MRFHHPTFDAENFTSYPTIEELLSEVQVNEQLFEASRQYDGNFTQLKLQRARRDLLLEIASWFHEISKSADSSDTSSGWLDIFRERVISENAAIISFNWDLILDKLIFSENISDKIYGLRKANYSGPILLKPHGSLNWLEGELGKAIKREKRSRIFRSSNDESVYAFQRFRAPVSRSSKTYTPLIVPPVYLKNFERPMFQRLWRKCTEVLSTSEKVVFLGYSMPATDLHAQFIMRCGFNNQVKGELADRGRRKEPTGKAAVIVVNPDRTAANRVQRIVGRDNFVDWVSTPVGTWLERTKDEPS